MKVTNVLTEQSDNLEEVSHLSTEILGMSLKHSDNLETMVNEVLNSKPFELRKGIEYIRLESLEIANVSELEIKNKYDFHLWELYQNSQTGKIKVFKVH